MNKTREEAVKTSAEIEKNMPETDVEVVLAPPFVYLEAVRNVITNIKLAAQNCFWSDFGAYTGEVSAKQLTDYCSYIIVGHSERIKYQNEQNEDIAKKIKAVLKSGLTPILCVGEDLSQREAEQTENIIRTKVVECLSKIKDNEVKNVIIAYEPIWSISTTENRKDCTKEDAKEAAFLIKKIISEKFDVFDIKVFFGGNVNPENAVNYLHEEEFAGVLVGGASLDAEKFIKIIEKAEKC